MFRRAFLSALLAAGLLAPQMAHAQRGPGETVGRQAAQQQQAARRDVQEGKLIPMPQVIAALNKRTPGRNLDARIDRIGERQVYRIPWVTSDGRRIDYVVDAQSGAILSGG